MKTFNQQKRSLDWTKGDKASFPKRRLGQKEQNELDESLSEYDSDDSDR